MKRTAMPPRSKPLARAGRLRPRSSTSARARRVRDYAFMGWVKAQPCAARGLPGHVCAPGPCEAHHSGSHGLGDRASDSTCIAMCGRAHDEWHDGGPTFDGWGWIKRREWADARIAETQQRYALTGAQLAA